MPISISDDIKARVNGALYAGTPLLLAVVDASHKPRLSFRGSTQVFSDDSLGFWARSPGGETIQAIAANPHVAFMYRNPTDRVFLQFAGRARLAEGADRDRVYEQAPEYERNADPERKGVGVIVELDKIEGLAGFDEAGKPIGIRLKRD